MHSFHQRIFLGIFCFFLEESFSDGFSIKALDPFRQVISQFRVVCDFLGDRVGFERDICEFLASAQIVQLVETLDIVTFEVQYAQVLEETDVEKFIYIVEIQIEFLQVLEGLYALDFLQLTPGEVKDPHELERGADISEALDQRVIHLEVLKGGEDFSDHLKVVARGIYSQFNLL